MKDLTLANGLATGTTVTGPATNQEGFLVVQAGPETLGGGILNMGVLTLDDVTLVNNQADASALGGLNAGGGGIANVLGGTLTVTNSNFQSNHVLAGSGDGYGGAILNDAGSVLAVNNSTFTSNSVVLGVYLGSFGGAIANLCSQATVSGSCFTSNVVRGGDGAPGIPVSRALTEAMVLVAASPLLAGACSTVPFRPRP